MSTIQKKAPRSQKYLVVVLMILSLCTIYVLPYFRYQFFTPLQEAMGLIGRNQDYGNLVSVYGIMNVLMYIPGGIIADKFDPKKLLVFSMISSGALGLWMATWPGYETLLLIHVLWGITTVLTFWSSSIKVVNMLAAADEQGQVFGMLEGGRGVAGIILNTTWVALFAFFSSKSSGNMGMTVIVTIVSLLMICSGLLLAFLLPKSDMSKAVNTSLKDSLISMGKTFTLPITWILAAMIFVCSAIMASGAYHAPYLQGACGLTVVMASAFAVFRGDASRITASIIYGSASKKMGRSSFLLLFSCVMLIGLCLILRFVPGSVATMWPLLIAMTLVAFFCCGNRAVYWATIEEAGTPKYMVGSVIGVASLFGYLPDTFIHSLYGGWLDKYEFTVAYNRIFTFCIVTAIVGTAFAFAGERLLKARQMKLKAEAAAAQPTVTE